MKKLITMLTLLALVLCCAMPCLAATLPSGENGDVYAKFVDATKGEYKAAVANGEVEITLPDGIKITVSGVSGNGLTLAIIPITKDQKDAYDWFTNALKDYGTNVYPLDIYFLDENGNRVAITGSITITITLPDGYTAPIICYTDENGKTQVVDSTVKDGKITFTTTHNSYYSLAEKKAAEPTPAPTPEPSTPQDSAPQTSDNSAAILWLSLLLVSAAAFTIVSQTRKKKNSK